VAIPLGGVHQQCDRNGDVATRLRDIMGQEAFVGWELDFRNAHMISLSYPKCGMASNLWIRAAAQGKVKRESLSFFLNQDELGILNLIKHEPMFECFIPNLWIQNSQ
jgi:hypothetical protein